MPLYQPGPFQDFVPVFSSASGTLGTYTINSARYRRDGKKIEIAVDVSITSAGTTPGGALQFSIPFTALYGSHAAGREITLTGKGLNFGIGAGSGFAIGNFYDNTFPGGNGNRILISGFYEAV